MSASSVSVEKRERAGDWALRGVRVGIAVSVVSAGVAVVAVAVVVLCGAALTMESTWKVRAKVRGTFMMTRGRDLIPLVVASTAAAAARGAGDSAACTRPCSDSTRSRRSRRRRY